MTDDGRIASTTTGLPSSPFRGSVHSRYLYVQYCNVPMEYLGILYGSGSAHSTTAPVPHFAYRPEPYRSKFLPVLYPFFMVPG
jgi:hypothetical protein